MSRWKPGSASTSSATYLRASGLSTYVLGISGGVDSLAAALLAQRAVEELRSTGYEAKFLAVRLPYGTQADESDAQRALDTIQADEVLRIDIRPAADAMLEFDQARRRRSRRCRPRGFPARQHQGASAHDRPIRAGRRHARSGHRHRSCGRGTDGLFHQVRRRRRRHPSSFGIEQTPGSRLGGASGCAAGTRCQGSDGRPGEPGSASPGRRCLWCYLRSDRRLPGRPAGRRSGSQADTSHAFQHRTQARASGRANRPPFSA